MSLRTKMILTYVLCIVMTLVPLIVIIQMDVKTMNREQAEAQTLQLIRSKAGELGGWLNQRVSEIRIIQEHPACRRLNFDQLKPYLNRLNRILQTQYGNPQESFAIGGMDGRGWVSDQITINISDRSYFYEAMSGDAEYVTSKPVVSKSDSNPIFVICYPIVDPLGRKIGFINGSVNLDRLTGIAEEIDIYDGLVWIMNEDAIPYTINEQQLLEHNLSVERLKSMVETQKDVSSGIVPLQNLTGEDFTLFYASIPHSQNWLLCIAIENSKIYAQTNQIIYLLLLMCLLMLGLGIVFAVWISGSITRPVRQLRERMLAVSSGDLSYSFQGYGKDELSALGNVYNQMMEDIRNLLSTIQQVEQQKRTAELRALQSQINPHFLYNTLDTIQWKALEHNAEDVADMVQMLSRLFRLSLSDGKEYVFLQDEMEHVETYLQIQKIRYGDKIQYSINWGRELASAPLPKLLIQPLVENAIYHGIKPKKEPGTIAISVGIRDGEMCIAVEDDGVGIPESRLHQIRTNLQGAVEWEHYGLYNVNERLRLAFGQQGHLILDSEEGKGTRVQISIPSERGNLSC